MPAVVACVPFEYPLFSNLESSAGLLTILNAYKHLYACILVCKDITVFSQPWFYIISTMALMLQSEDLLFYILSKSTSNKAQLDESWLGV